MALWQAGSSPASVSLVTKVRAHTACLRVNRRALAQREGAATARTPAHSICAVDAANCCCPPLVHKTAHRRWRGGGGGTVGVACVLQWALARSGNTAPPPPHTDTYILYITSI